MMTHSETKTPLLLINSKVINASECYMYVNNINNNNIKKRLY